MTLFDEITNEFLRRLVLATYELLRKEHGYTKLRASIQRVVDNGN